MKLSEITDIVKEEGRNRNIDVVFFQSNSEGDIVTYIQEKLQGKCTLKHAIEIAGRFALSRKRRNVFFILSQDA